VSSLGGSLLASRAKAGILSLKLKLSVSSNASEHQDFAVMCFEAFLFSRRLLYLTPPVLASPILRSTARPETFPLPASPHRVLLSPAMSRANPSCTHTPSARAAISTSVCHALSSILIFPYERIVDAKTATRFILTQQNPSSNMPPVKDEASFVSSSLTARLSFSPHLIVK
jgi:hypothetical protein